MSGPQMERRMLFAEEQLQQLAQVVTAATRPLELKIQELQTELVDVKQQLAHGDQRMNELAGGIKRNNASTAEMRDMFETCKKGIKFLGTIGAGLKWFAGMLAMASAAYTYLKGWHR